MRKRAWIGALLALALAAAIGLCLHTFAFRLTRVSGVSMRETLCEGDIALVTLYDYRAGAQPSRGDVVQCRFDGRPDEYIKRLVAVPGDTLQFSGGEATLNGAPLVEPYVTSETGDFSIELGADEYLMLGDNRRESYDSRMVEMGTVSRGDILGRVRWILWPLSRFGAVS